MTPPPPDSNRPLSPWEAHALNAVANVIEFWGFKRNHGRIWTLLYLRNEAMSAAQIQDLLDLSKGAVSMLTRELEQWGVIQRRRPLDDTTWHFEARTDLLDMIRRVLLRRERELLARVHDDLRRAEDLAREDPEVSPEALARLHRLVTINQFVATALSTLIQTATLDFRGLIGALVGRSPRGTDDA